MLLSRGVEPLRKLAALVRVAMATVMITAAADLIANLPVRDIMRIGPHEDCLPRSLLLRWV
jgi:hypothetical protein